MGRGRRRKRVRPQGSRKKEEREGRDGHQMNEHFRGTDHEKRSTQRIALLGDCRALVVVIVAILVVVRHSRSQPTPHGLVQPINTNAFRSQTPKNPLVPSRDNEQPEVHSMISFLVAQPFR